MTQMPSWGNSPRGHRSLGLLFCDSSRLNAAIAYETLEEFRTARADYSDDLQAVSAAALTRGRGVAQDVHGHPAAMIMNRGDAPWVYTLEESAEILRCEPGWLEEQAQQDKIPYTKLGGSQRFTSGHLAAIVAIHERLPAHKPGAVPLSPPRAWSTAEAAELLRCTASWLREQARSNTIPYVKLSGSYHFTDANLAEILRIFGVQPPRASTPRAPRTPGPPRTAPGREPATLKSRQPRDLRRRRARDDDPGIT